VGKYKQIWSTQNFQMIFIPTIVTLMSAGSL